MGIVEKQVGGRRSPTWLRKAAGRVKEPSNENATHVMNGAGRGLVSRVQTETGGPGVCRLFINVATASWRIHAAEIEATKRATLQMVGSLRVIGVRWT